MANYRKNPNETSYNAETQAKANAKYLSNEDKKKAHLARQLAQDIKKAILNHLGIDPNGWIDHHVRNGDNSLLFILRKDIHTALHSPDQGGFGRKNSDCRADAWDDCLFDNQGDAVMKFLMRRADVFFVYESGRTTEYHGRNEPFVEYAKPIIGSVHKRPSKVARETDIKEQFLIPKD